MADPDARGLRVVVGDAHGRPLAAHGLARWLRQVAPSRARGTVSVAIVSDRRVRALNRIYRRKDAATDVLSFPVADTKALPRRTRTTALRARMKMGTSRTPKYAVSSGFGSVPSVLELFLGEIVIARGVARRQARAAGHDEPTELRVLALHGLLHLIGYEHERDDGEMRRVEERLRRKGGLREGLIARGSPASADRRRRRPA